MSIQVQALTKVYGQQKAVDGISFNAGTGVLGFLGPNGAGKSTTMKMLTCFIPQTSGTASVCGFDINRQPLDVKRNIGYLPESNPLYTDMYVKESLAFMAGIHGIHEPARSIAEVIEQTGLGPEQHKKISQLSKGYRQRVGLAQAILHNPQVLILDEPTSGLDPNQLIGIRQLITDLGKTKTIILSTHIMQEVEAVCQRVIIVNSGKIVADDSLAGLRKSNNGNSLENIFIGLTNNLSGN
ncbi:ATP-binding cassette domain-containing protein [Mucilaginibacter sp. AK015]|uniref:ATP-binding cassette domain-containing protein n=1 Tax=Mucilaginibacter sp. AK015 TaxID=2723072 RepID=UPI00160B33CF|nr:ATP-binding cassette domain-containing protein [Mucilaginibacter sp. AK015]MBB5397564.1 ABC-2 type transport system ATP-binding protein [Mucilaginibacter sp. AK015]